MKKNSLLYTIKSEPMIWVSLLSIVIAFCMSFNFFINNDGIYYVNGAESLLRYGTEGTHPSLVWPFYPFLIACLSYITGLTTEHSALILQALFQVVLIISFIQIIRLLGGNKSVQALAGLTILLHPDINAYRDSIIRDFGYWAFLFTSFYHFLRYEQQPSWRRATFWFLSAAIALLFRIEGIVIIALTPLLGFLLTERSWETRLINAFRLYSFWIVITVAIILFLIIQGKELASLGRVAEFSLWWHALTGEIADKWDTLIAQESSILPLIHEDTLKAFLFGGFIAYLVYVLIKTITPLYLGIVVYGQWKHYLARFAGHLEQRLVLGFLAINLFIPFIFVFDRFFLRGRFVTPAVITLLLWVPFTIYTVYRQNRRNPFIKKYYKSLKALFVVLIIVLLVDSTVSFNSPGRMIKDSADWIEKHTDDNALLYSNSSPLIYYAHRPGSNPNTNPMTPPLEVVLKNKRWEHYDYLALYITRKDKDTEKLIEKTIPYPPIKRFENNRGYQVWLYKVEK